MHQMGCLAILVLYEICNSVQSSGSPLESLWLAAQMALKGPIGSRVLLTAWAEVEMARSEVA